MFEELNKLEYILGNMEKAHKALGFTFNYFGKIEPTTADLLCMYEMHGALFQTVEYALEKSIEEFRQSVDNLYTIYLKHMGINREDLI